MKLNKYLIGIGLILFIIGIVLGFTTGEKQNEGKKETKKEEQIEKNKEITTEDIINDEPYPEFEDTYWLSKDEDISNYVFVSSFSDKMISFMWINNNKIIGNYRVVNENGIFHFTVGDVGQTTECTLNYNKETGFTIDVPEDNKEHYISKGEYKFIYKINRDEFKELDNKSIDENNNSNDNKIDEEKNDKSYDFSIDINCNNKSLSIYDIYHFNEIEGDSLTYQYTKIGTYLPKQLNEDVTSYFLINSGYACEYIEYNKNAKESSEEDTLLASITEDNMKKAIEKLYGLGNYNRYDYIMLGAPNSCNGFNFNKNNNKYELRVINGCGGTSASQYKVTNKEIKTNGENTIITEYVTEKELDTNKTNKIKIEYTVRTSDKVLIKIVTSKA